MFSEAKTEAKRRLEDGKKISTTQQVCEVWCMSQICSSGPLMCCSPVPHQVVQRVGPSNGNVSPSLLAKATSPLRPTNSPPPPTSPAATTPLLRGSSGGNTNREDMPNGPSAQNKASSHARLHADGKVISDSRRYHTPMSLVVVVLPRLRQPADSTSLLTPLPPHPPVPRRRQIMRPRRQSRPWTNCSLRPTSSSWLWQQGEDSVCVGLP